LVLTKDKVSQYRTVRPSLSFGVEHFAVVIPGELRWYHAKMGRSPFSHLSHPNPNPNLTLTINLTPT